MGLVDQIHVEEPVEEADSSNGPRKITPLILSGILLAGLIGGGILLHGGEEAEETGQADRQSAFKMQEVSVATQVELAKEEPIVELDLLLRATEKTWLRIQADSSEPWETTMKTGDEIRLKGPLAFD